MKGCFWPIAARREGLPSTKKPFLRINQRLAAFRFSCVFYPGIKLRNHFTDLAIFPFRGANDCVPGDIQAVIQGGPRKFPAFKTGGYQIPLQYADSVS